MAQGNHSEGKYISGLVNNSTPLHPLLCFQETVTGPCTSWTFIQSELNWTEEHMPTLDISSWLAFYCFGINISHYYRPEKIRGNGNSVHLTWSEDEMCFHN